MTSYTCLPDTDGQAGGIRLAVFVDSDGFGRKHGGTRLDWNEIMTFPYTPLDVSAWSGFLVNTCSKDGSWRRTNQISYERAASKCGFRVYNRSEKRGESTRRTAFTQGSRAALGALIGLYASSLDAMVVHDCSSQTAESLNLVLGKNPHLQVVVVASRPSRRTIEVSRIHSGRMRILDPNLYPHIHLSDDPRPVVRPEVPEISPRTSTIRDKDAMLIDGANYLGWGKTISDKADALYDSSELAKRSSGESIIVISDRRGGSRNKDAVLDRHWREPWQKFRVLMDGNRAVEDGLIGALMGYLATTHREITLMSSDSDFIECQRIIKNEMGTRMNTICPPVTKMPEHHPNFMGTKPEVVSNQYSNWICAFTGLPDKMYHVPEFEYPRELASGHLFNASRARKKEIRSKRREFRSGYLNRVRDLLSRVKVQVPADSETRILASARREVGDYGV